MNCPHTWFSTELKGGKRLLRTRLRDLLRPAPKRGRTLAVLAAALALCAGALVACRTAPAEESNAPELAEDEIADTVLRLAPAALGLEEGDLTLSKPFSIELNGTPFWFCDLLQGEWTVAEVSADLSAGTVQLLPHRYPFLLVDKIIEMGTRHIVGVKNVSGNEPFFQGHFPAEPIMPGVLLVEAMAQTGGLLVLNTVDEPERYSTYFMKIDNVKFRQKVVPGDTVIFHLSLMSEVRRGCAYMKGYAFVGERITTEAEFMAQIIKNK